MKRPSRNDTPMSQIKHNLTSRVSTTNRKRRLLGRIVLGLVAVAGMATQAQVSQACDYCDSVEVNCAACDGMSCDAMGCDGIGCDAIGGGCKMVRGGVFRALDAVAGGVERLMGFDKCGQSSCGCDSLSCDSMSCDGGCGSMMSGEMMMPMAPVEMAPTNTHVHQHVHSPAPAYSAPLPPIATPRMAAPRMAAPRHPQFRMSEPTIVSPHAAPHQSAPVQSDQMEFDNLESQLDSSFEAAPSMSTPRTSTPRTSTPRTSTPRVTTPRSTPRASAPIDRLPTIDRTPSPDPAPNAFEAPAVRPAAPAPKTPAPKNDGGGLFDALDDPFGDDVRVLPRSRPTIQPSNYRKTQLSQPIRLGAPQASVRTQTQQRTAKAALQHRSSRAPSLARSSSSAHRHVATSHRKAVPLRTGSSFRSYSQASPPIRVATRQVSHQHSRTAASSRRSNPQFSPAPAPRQFTAPQQVKSSDSVRRQTTGQRHSSAGYSGYGHTTNRR
ncbi:hypothetical protein [Planctomycetes bacterium K23_9]|uniref:Uncharacterized protein n=1 Tax=Stieleria marina TaxID=1930275 RepID=A0A517NR05_9BACT|nr:hypothetical protein K239x_15050 [Planctomycetes bacterium K23_9]